jgi:hypothetical protein
MRTEIGIPRLVILLSTLQAILGVVQSRVTREAARGADVQAVQFAGRRAQALALVAPAGDEVEDVLRGLSDDAGRVGEPKRIERAGIAQPFALGPWPGLARLSCGQISSPGRARRRRPGCG